MPDLADLDHTWSVLESRADAHPLPDMSVPVRRRHRPRRPAFVISAGAGVAAMAVGAALLGTRAPSLAPAAPVSAAARPSTAVAPEPAPAWTTTLPTGHYLVLLDRVPGARFTSVIGVGTPEVAFGDGTYQEVQIVSPEGGFVVKVNAQGGWRPAGGTEVDVDGRPAFYNRFLLHPEIPGHPVQPRVALAWQYQPGAWATIGSTSDVPIPLATAQRLVAQLRIGVGAAIPDPPPQGP